MNKFMAALKDNTNNIRQNLATVVIIVAGAIVSGVILNKAANDRVDVILLQETTPDEEVVEGELED